MLFHALPLQQLHWNNCINCTMCWKSIAHLKEAHIEWWWIFYNSIKAKPFQPSCFTFARVCCGSRWLGLGWVGTSDIDGGAGFERCLMRYKGAAHQLRNPKIIDWYPGARHSLYLSQRHNRRWCTFFKLTYLMPNETLSTPTIPIIPDNKEI